MFNKKFFIMRNMQSLRRTELLALMGKFALSFPPGKDQMNVMAATNLVTDLYKKDDDAYHMLRVAMLAIHFGFKKADDIISALLHSCLEDKTMDLISLGQMFGNDVLMKVSLLSAFAKEFSQSYGAGIAMSLSPSSREVVKIIVADFYDNAFRLKECKDIQTRSRLSREYRPVFQTLISAIEANKIGFNPQLIPEILQGLKGGLEFAKKN